MRRASAIVAGLFSLAVFLGTPVHKAFAHEHHEEASSCTDGQPLTHFDDCEHELDAHCALSVHSADPSVAPADAVELFSSPQPAVDSVVPSTDEVASLHPTRGPPVSAI